VNKRGRHERVQFCEGRKEIAGGVGVLGSEGEEGLGVLR